MVDNNERKEKDMKKPIYVFGHANPDTDSICAAISYAHLKHALGCENAVAMRLGKLNKETRYVLDYFGVEEPELLTNIKPQVGDMTYYEVPATYVVDSVKKAWGLMTETGHKMIPILYHDHKLAGVVSISDIAKTYIGLTDGSVLKENKTPFVNILAVLNGKLVCGDYPYAYVSGNVYTTASIEMDQQLTDGDILITGMQPHLKEIAFKSGAGCIIFTNQDMESLDDLSKIQDDVPMNFKGAIVCVPHTFFKAIKIISQSISVKNVMKTQNLMYFQTDETLEEAREVMVTSNHSQFPIVNRQGHVKGTVSKHHLLDIKRKQVILVDHNEVSQSVPGIEQAEILEIIDHHRIANLDTGSPVFFRAEPVGCTCTIIGKMYDENNIMPPPEIAGIMLSAILSDTLIFHSPTCTNEDIRVAKKLAQIAGVEIKQYGMDMIAAGTMLEDVTPNELMHMDMKYFTLGQYHAAVSQVNTGDYNGIFNMRDAIIEEMETLCINENLDICLLMVTNLIVGGTELIVVGSEKWIADQAFEIRKDENSVFLPNVYSRKKQIIPKLMNFTQNKI